MRAERADLPWAAGAGVGKKDKDLPAQRTLISPAAPLSVGLVEGPITCLTIFKYETLVQIRFLQQLCLSENTPTLGPPVRAWETGIPECRKTGNIARQPW